MSEIILSIKTVFDVKVDHGMFHDDCDGYEIKTTERTLHLLIDNYGQCCERFDYLSTPDDTDYFIGAELYAWKDTETDRIKARLQKETDGSYGGKECCSCCDAQFITLFTSKGEITFAVYNDHNGYYSHGAFILENGDIVEARYI